MRRIKIVGFCLLAAAAANALAAASASASAPEFGRCLKAAKVAEKYTGAFENSTCTKGSPTHTGKFEWHPGAVKVKQTTSGGLAALATVGELVTKKLEGTVGVIKRSFNAKKEEVPLKNQLGFDLFPEGRIGLFIEFACVGLTVKVQGSVIVPIASNKMALTTELKFAAEKGKQKPEGFEGEPKDILEASFRGGPFEQAGQTETTILTNEEKLELNSVV